SSDGTMREFMPLIGNLVLSNRVDVLPLWLGGTHKALPKGAKVPLPRKRKVEVRIGPPLTFEQLEQRVAGMKRSDAYRAVARLPRDAGAALRDGWQLGLEREAAEKAKGLQTISEARLSKSGAKSPVTLLFEDLQGRFVPGA